jgi:beta-aspartyl-peptidase (threonine type)
MLVGRGALKFACSQGIPEIEDAELQPFIPAGVKKNGTVGVVVLDKNGNLAAGTSSGGVYPKLPGRVGDSAIIGCGAYCNSTCGVSVSGEGEKILQVQLARNAADRIRSQEPMIAAKESIIDFSTRTSGFAGLIAIDSNGRIGYSFNTQNMAIGFWNEKCGKNIKC